MFVQWWLSNLIVYLRHHTKDGSPPFWLVSHNWHPTATNDAIECSLCLWNPPNPFLNAIPLSKWQPKEVVTLCLNRPKHKKKPLNSDVVMFVTVMDKSIGLRVLKSAIKTAIPDTMPPKISLYCVENITMTYIADLGIKSCIGCIEPVGIRVTSLYSLSLLRSAAIMLVSSVLDMRYLKLSNSLKLCFKMSCSLWIPG